MAFVMEENESSNPANVSLFGANTVVSRTDGGADPIEQFWGRRLHWLRRHDARALSSLTHEFPQQLLLETEQR
jgi:hypothetical protein